MWAEIARNAKDKTQVTRCVVPPSSQHRPTKETCVITSRNGPEDQTVVELTLLNHSVIASYMQQLSNEASMNHAYMQTAWFEFGRDWSPDHFWKGTCLRKWVLGRATKQKFKWSCQHKANTCTFCDQIPQLNAEFTDERMGYEQWMSSEKKLLAVFKVQVSDLLNDMTFDDIVAPLTKGMCYW